MESKGCFDFFCREANWNLKSAGFGLIRDRAPGAPHVSSIASVGFGLSALVIGCHRGWITYEQAYERAYGTLGTLLNLETVHGFYYHFIDMEKGKRIWESEVSVIDTAILICGVLTAGEYFGQDIKKLAEELYLRVEWDWYVDHKRSLFYMGYLPERGHFGSWDFYAEQLMMYFLGAGSPSYPVSGELMYEFERHYGSYDTGKTFIYTPVGSLFTYQFSHAWFDLRNTADRSGVDWFENSVEAVKANRQYCIDNNEGSKTFDSGAWGLSACDGPNGYIGDYGSLPSGDNFRKHFTDGTVPPYGAAASIVFLPNECIETLELYYNRFPECWGEYGFKDAFSLDVSPNWFGEDYIGIDKGISLLMIENYRSGLIWDVFMKNNYVRNGMGKCGIKQLNSIRVESQLSEALTA
jgi:hypothetical protein